MNRQNVIWLKVSGVLLVAFLLGGITGLSLGGLIARPTSTASTSLRDPEAYYRSLQRELDLTTAQSTEIKSILDDTRLEYRKVCSEVRPRYDALREQARNRMRSLLTPSQQQKFDNMVLQEDCSTCPDRGR
jgi:Spy/CpxP family protein refolding chaperone